MLFSPSRIRCSRLSVAVVLMVMAGQVRFAPAAHREGFDTPTPSWRLSGMDCNAQIRLRERTFHQPDVHSGAGAEYVRLYAEQGTYVYLIQDVGQARVIRELEPSLWIRANRPGIQVLARVVLPRSRNPRDGTPLTLLVEGTLYDQPGAWRQLTIPDVLLQVQRKARVMRAQPEFGPDVDEREAYLDLIVLNAYGGPGTTDLWIDDLEIEGYSQAGAASLSPGTAAGGAERHQPTPHEAEDNPFWTVPAGQDQPPHLEGGALVAGRGPIAVRMIEHRGESFAWLKSLGFNAVRLPRPATPQELEEAKRLGVWLAAPPPHVTGRTELTTAHDRVLAWDLGSGLRNRDTENARRVAQAIRRDDPRSARPILAGAEENAWAYRRMADVLLAGGEPLGAAGGISAFRRRLAEQAGRGSRHAPIWAEIQTEPHRAVRGQLDALAGEAFDARIEAAQVRRLVDAAIEAGASGFCFRSRSPLDAGDPASQARAAVLHAVNQELSLIEPWVAGPSRLETLETGLKGLTATALETDRSKLILVTQHNADEQYVAAPCPERTVSLLVSGVPTSWKAYRIAADRLLPLSASQVGGGVRVTAPDVGRTALLVVTDDALTVNYLARRLRQTAEARAKLRHEVISRELASAEAVVAEAPPDVPSRAEIAQRLEEARAAMRRCESLLDASDAAGSLAMAERAEQLLSQLRRLTWAGAADAFSSRSASPWCIHFTALPLHWKLTERIGGAAWGPNSLASGDFENFQHMRAAGWTQERADESAAFTHVELSPDRPRQGRYSLHLAAQSQQGTLSASTETPPVRVTSAAVPAARGALLRIRGWVRIVSAGDEQPVLRIVDSLGETPLSETFGAAPDWRPFTLYRAASRPEQVKVTFELVGHGEAWIDEVTVEILSSTHTAGASYSDGSVERTGR